VTWLVSTYGRIAGGGGPVSNRLDEWVPRVYRFALRLCQDCHMAEDLTQETILRAWRQRNQLRTPASMRIWLFRIASNLWRDRLRRNRSPIAQASSLDSSEPTRRCLPDKLASEKDELKQALAALDSLPARQREVLYLNTCEEMTSAEIAELLEISRDAVKANLSLARKRMRELVRETEPNPAGN